MRAYNFYKFYQYYIDFVANVNWDSQYLTFVEY